MKASKRNTVEFQNRWFGLIAKHGTNIPMGLFPTRHAAEWYAEKQWPRPLNWSDHSEIVEYDIE